MASDAYTGTNLTFLHQIIEGKLNIYVWTDWKLTMMMKYHIQVSMHNLVLQAGAEMK